MDGRFGSHHWLGGMEGTRCNFREGSYVATKGEPRSFVPRSPLMSASLLQLPRLWLMYLSIFSHPRCPTILSHTHARRTYDRALRTLPPSLHGRIWVRYLLWA